MAPRDWVLKRNCSLSPRQTLLAYAVLCAMSLLVASFFVAQGAWLVLGFAAIELLSVGVAFVLYARHATDREHIALNDDCLLVELIEVEKVMQFRLDPRRTRVEPPEGRDLIGLQANGISVKVGRFLTERKRREFARELQRALASDRQTEFQF